MNTSGGFICQQPKKVHWVFFVLFCTSSVCYADASNNRKPPAPRLEGMALMDALKAGGYIIYFRHGITDHSIADTDRSNLKNCATQRPLSAEGRRQMREIGQAIAKLGIRASTIVSSPYCRSIDTATLAFGRTDVSYDLRHTVAADEATAMAQAKGLKSMLSTPPPQKGTNTVISGHTANLQEATGIWPKPEGVAIVFRPETSGFSYVATILPNQWTEFANHY